ncbi:MAG: EamA family transporter [Firmicutes bacterium]|nr:EamA family transporter [Bacillota bacterium]
MDDKKQLKGVIITLIAGTLWGFSGTCAQFLFEDFGITPLYLTNVRMQVTGIILVVFSLIKFRDKVAELFKNKGDLLRLAIFAILGILFNQLSYLETISYTNSGTATIIQYIGPVLIMIISCFIDRRLPTKIEVVAVVLVIVGTWLIATHGDFGSLYITPKGLVWGLLSALAVVFYTMIPIPLIDKYGSIPVTGFGMLIGGTALTVGNRFQGGPESYNARYLIYLAIIIILGTVVAYTGYLVGVKYCGAVKASMIASIEPVSATVFMVVWLGERFFAIDFVGFLCIFLTVFLLARKEQREEETLE